MGNGPGRDTTEPGDADPAGTRGACQSTSSPPGQLPGQSHPWDQAQCWETKMLQMMPPLAQGPGEVTLQVSTSSRKFWALSQLWLWGKRTCKNCWEMVDRTQMPEMLKSKKFQERQGGLWHEILTHQITKDSDLPQEFQGAHLSNRKARCAPHGLGEEQWRTSQET